jgi:predicted kinase
VIVVALIVLSGPPGVGKSTVADALAALHPAARLSIDDVEEAMRACGIPDAQTGVAAYEVVRAAAEQNLAIGHVPTGTAATPLRGASVPAAWAQ